MSSPSNIFKQNIKPMDLNKLLFYYLHKTCFSRCLNFLKYVQPFKTVTTYNYNKVEKIKMYIMPYSRYRKRINVGH